MVLLLRHGCPRLLESCKIIMNNTDIKQFLVDLADKYETVDFLSGDPSWFMHQVKGVENQEAMAFIAASLSYGSRKQFMPKIDWFLQISNRDIHKWILQGEYKQHFSVGDGSCFYRLYSKDTMRSFLDVYCGLLNEYGTLGNFLRTNSDSGYSALAAICSYFSQRGIAIIIPKNLDSACKRLCMFLRWMVRTDSPVDLGLWSDFIDRRTLIIPLDTHVAQQAFKLKIVESVNSTMKTAIKITNYLAEIFPDDPLRGDFALFGYGVNSIS